MKPGPRGFPSLQQLRHRHHVPSLKPHRGQRGPARHRIVHAGPARGSGGLRSKSIPVPCLCVSRVPRRRKRRGFPRWRRRRRLDQDCGALNPPGPGHVLDVWTQCRRRPARSAHGGIGVTTSSVIWLISRSPRAGTRRFDAFDDAHLLSANCDAVAERDFLDLPSGGVNAPPDSRDVRHLLGLVPRLAPRRAFRLELSPP